MKNNTVIPTSREDAEKKLASNPATRYMMDQKQAEQAAKEGRSAELPSVKPIPKKKSGWQKFKDYTLDGWHELVDEKTPEEKEAQQKYSEELYEVNKQRADKKKKNLTTTVVTTLPLLVGGAGLAGGAGAKGLAKVLGAGATGVATGTVVDALMDNKKKAKAETVPTNTDNVNNDATNTPKDINDKDTNDKYTNDKPPTTTPKTEEEDKTYDNYIAKVAKQQGLGKYVKEDGTVDYDKLQKSKVGYQILNALIAGIGGAAAGAAFKDAPDMSKSMLAQEVAKRDRVADEAQKTAEQEKQNALDLSIFATKLGLQGQQSLNFQKEMARVMSNLSYNEKIRMMNYLKNMTTQDAMKLGFAQNPYGSIGSLFGLIGGLANTFSDESCKKFASRKVFK